MIDGLKLTLTGVQLRAELEKRISWHQNEKQRCSSILKAPNRSAQDYAESDAMLEDEIRRVEVRIETLTFIRDYVLADEVYRLGEFDLRFADLVAEEDLYDCGCSSYRRSLPSANHDDNRLKAGAGR